MKRLKKGKFMRAEDLIGLMLQAEAIRMNVRQIRAEIRVHTEDPLEVLLRIADLIEAAADPGGDPPARVKANRHDVLDVRFPTYGVGGRRG